MGLRSRILSVVQLESGGPRKRSVLSGLARTPVQVEQFPQVFRRLVADGDLVKYSDRRQALYGPPGLRRRAGGWVAKAPA